MKREQSYSDKEHRKVEHIVRDATAETREREEG
jgi:hypothetical protein